MRLPSRGAAPAISYAIVATKVCARAYRFGGSLRLPCAMALRLIRARPGDPALCDTIALGQRWPPSNLTPASGRRTQTISPYARTALVSRDLTSTAPCPSFATMAYAPLVGQDGGSPTTDLPDGSTEIFLSEGLDRLLVICPSGYFVARARVASRLRAEATRECATLMGARSGATSTP